VIVGCVELGWSIVSRNQTGNWIDRSPADKGTDCEIEQNHIYSHRNVAAGYPVNDSTADNGGDTAKDKNPQFSADIHTFFSPVATVGEGLYFVYLNLAIPTNNSRKSKEKSNRSKVWGPATQRSLKI
jgi:hypothetical protein